LIAEIKKSTILAIVLWLKTAVSVHIESAMLAQPIEYALKKPFLTGHENMAYVPV